MGMGTEMRSTEMHAKGPAANPPLGIPQRNARDANLKTALQMGDHADGLFLIAALIGIASVAYADSLVMTISLGYLYVLPLSLSALTQHRRITLILAVLCVLLHDWLGPYGHSGWPVLYRSLLTLIGFLTVVLLVGKLAEQRSLLMRMVRAQRDELALELRHAAEVQQRLLPQKLPDLPALEFAGLMSPAKDLGGDYYDYIQLPQGNIGLVIADVSGKGTEAALFMPSIEVALRMDSPNSTPTDGVISNLNTVLYELAEQTRYVTLFYAKLDVARRTLQYTNAGHFPPLILRVHEPESWLTEGGPVVGLLPEAVYQTANAALLPGDVLILYTDGVIEPENSDGEQFSIARLVDIARANISRSAQELVQAIHSSVIAFAGTQELEDDFTVVVMKVLPEKGAGQL